MLHNSPSNIAACIDVTSKARLSSYSNFFNVGEAEAYSIYKWNNELSSRAIHLIGIVEIILRNRIHNAFKLELDMVYPKGGTHNDDWYNYINNPPDTQRKLNAELIHKKSGTPLSPAPTANQIVSKMSFGLWPNILKNASKISIGGCKTNINWDRAFRSIFPGLPNQPLGYWTNFSNRDSIVARCFSVNSLRNRAAHFEPLWKFGKDFVETIPRQGVARSFSPKPTTVEDMITRLRRDFDRVRELLMWLSPDTYNDYMCSENNCEIEWLISTNAIDSFKSHARRNEVIISTPQKPGCSAIMLEKKKVGIAFIYPQPLP